jgi:CBS domain-containing protein
MTSQPITVESLDKIAKARNLMIRREIDHLPVMSEDKLVGIVMSSDIVRAKVPKVAPRKYSRVHEPLRRLDPHVGGLMHTHLETCSPDDDALGVLTRIIKAHSTYSLVTRWEELQGIVTHRDFMKILMPPKETAVPTYIVGLPDDPFEAEAAKAKFERVVQRVRRSYPDLLEARAVIKHSRSSGERRRYEVQVQFKTTKEVQTYTEAGWELPAVFDVISDRLKRLTTERRGARRYRRRGRRARRR